MTYRIAWQIKVVVAVLLLAIGLTCGSASAADRSFDVVVYGGTSGGVTAAVQAARMGKQVALVSPTKHLGGLTSGGLGWTDMGNPAVVGGLSREFYHRVFQVYEDNARWKYGTPKAQFFAKAPGQHTKAVDTVNQVMWVFEPHVAEQVFDDLVRDAGITVVREASLDRSNGVTKAQGRITTMRTQDGTVYHAKVFIDATYEGDLMKLAGVSYFVGREANSTYGETINGIEVAKAVKNVLPKGVDPYKTPGEKTSGLLPGVNPDAGGADGSYDPRIQAYCYRMCLTDVPENRVPITKPDGYDPAQYELLFRCIEAGQNGKFMKFDLMPNRKTDSNNGSGMSTDFVGGNYAYPEADDATREEIAKAHRQWQLGLLWSLQNSPRVPEKIRQAYSKWGLPKDEFTDNDHWPYQLYVREARRMIGAFVETEHDLIDDSKITRPIGMGVYAIDSHAVQRYVDAEGHVNNEGDVQIRLKKPYRIDYGCITPKEDQCSNLLVPVCLSASHVAYGSIRMEPVFMVLGQSAGAAASLAIDGKTSVQGVPYDKLKDQLLAEKQILSN